MLRETAKPVVAIVASLCMGFYLGGRYVGALAKPETAKTALLGRPEWIGTAQSTMWIVLGMGVVCVFLWIGLDYLEIKA